MFKRLLVSIVVALAILLPGLIAAHDADAHQGYYSVYPSSTSTRYYFPDFYVSAGAHHSIQQTYPDNRLCYHRVTVRSTGQLVVGIWLRGNEDTTHSDPNYFTFGNPNGTSIAFRHSVQGCLGQVQVYVWH